MSSIDVGDEVVTTGGIIGMITYIEDDSYHVEIDHDVVIRVAKSAISQSASAPEPTSKASGSGSAKPAKPAPLDGVACSGRSRSCLLGRRLRRRADREHHTPTRRRRQEVVDPDGVTSASAGSQVRPVPVSLC